MPSAYEIDERIRSLCATRSFDPDFIYDLLAAYGIPASTIGRLKTGTLNRAKKNPGEVCWKNKVYAKHLDDGDPHAVIDDLQTSDLALKQTPRFVIVTGGDELVAVDTKTGDSLDVTCNELPKHFTFFFPWAGMEKHTHRVENLADVKAAERMAKLYDEIIKTNAEVANTDEFRSSLNVFFSRLLFCFFADDTGVFETNGQFLTSIASHTQADGSDLHRYLDELFDAFDVEIKSDYPSHLRTFPYVNGGLFGTKLSAPRFSQKARSLVLQCGELDWSEINPDIFGSMIQAVVHPGERGALGMHYTSVENIMKVIRPLFVEPLLDALEKAGDSRTKLISLRKRIASIKVFDPACGSGNFLVIAYKELRKIEHEIMERLRNLEGTDAMFDALEFERSQVSVDNFFGIEIDDFAHQIAQLSLHLASHQMNTEFKKQFGVTIPLVPLKESAHIVHANAARVDWNEVCPNNGTDEIYVIGNPPYQGATIQDAEQKADMAVVFAEYQHKTLDYVACWLFLASQYLAHSASRAAFVTTNSISQGEQVPVLWPILGKSVEVEFAHTSFKWANHAKSNAGVTCVVICLKDRATKGRTPRLFGEETVREVPKINGYLTQGPDVYVTKRPRSISHLPTMEIGSKPVDGGHLFLGDHDKDELLSRYPDAARFVRPCMGSADFIGGLSRWCLWIQDDDAEGAAVFTEIRSRLDAVRQMRNRSTKQNTRDISQFPHRFGQVRHRETESILVPRHSSERRDYVPMGYLGPETIILDSAMAIYDAEPYVFGLVSSRLHMTWLRAVGGRLKSDFRYSASLVYNTFPVPPLSDEQKRSIERNVFEIFDARERHPEKTLAELYDPDKMPDDLRRAHNYLDEVVDQVFRRRGFATDEERLTHLFDLYEQMTAAEKERLGA